MTRLSRGFAAIGPCVIEWEDATGGGDLFTRIARDRAGDPTIRWRARSRLASERAVALGEVVARFGTVEAREAPAGLRLDGHASHAIIEPGQVEIALDHPPSAREVRLLGSIALPLALRCHGFYHLHAGAVVSRGRAWVIVGDSGSGKTTTTLALLLNPEISWITDDTAYLARSKDGSALRAFGVPRPFHATERTLDAFPELRPLAGRAFMEGPTAKRELDPPRAFPGGYESGVAPVALIFPTIHASRSSGAALLSPREAFARLVAPSALGLVPGLPGREAHLAALGTLVGTTQSVELTLGPDGLVRPWRIGELIEDALRRCG